MEAPQKNLALDLVRVTEAAALACARWLGKGDKISADQAAVDAMRLCFNTLEIEGRVMIGEGEKDDAPMLYNGEKLGLGEGPKVDIAVDPLEGTNLLANGRPNAISVVGVAPAGAMFDPGPSYYMQKLVVPSQAKDVVDIEAPTGHNLKLIARALDKDVDDLVVFVLDKPRHKKLISDIREAGARIQLHTDGDITGSLMAIDPRCEVDVMMGTGGTPRGRALGHRHPHHGRRDVRQARPAEAGREERPDRIRHGRPPRAHRGRPGQVPGPVLRGHGHLGRHLPQGRVLPRPRRGDLLPGHARQDRHHPVRGGHPQLGCADEVLGRRVRLDRANNDDKKAGAVSPRPFLVNRERLVEPFDADEPQIDVADQADVRGVGAGNAEFPIRLHDHALFSEKELPVD